MPCKNPGEIGSKPAVLPTLMVFALPKVWMVVLAVALVPWVL